VVISAGEWYKSKKVFPHLFLDSLPSLVAYYLSSRNFLYLMFCFNKKLHPEIEKTAVAVLI